jgi:tRNA(Ile)-lysidine synthase TilS/MesJ
MRMMTGLAREMGADAIAIGHDLDDVATEVFISYLEGDISGLQYGRQETRPEGYEQGMIPTIQPLRRIPGKEVRLYALQHGLCFAEMRLEDELHKEARQELCRFDSRHPGTKYSLLRSLEKLDKERSDRSGSQRSKAFK